MSYDSTRVIAISTTDGSDFAETYPGCEFSEGSDGTLRIIEIETGKCCAIYRAGIWVMAERCVESKVSN